MTESTIEQAIAQLRTEAKISRTAINRIHKDIGLLLKTIDDIRLEIEDLASVTDVIRADVNDVKKTMVRKLELQQITEDIARILENLAGKL